MKPEKHDCSRRDFLKHSLLGAVALGVASFPGEPLTGAIRNIEGRRKENCPAGCPAFAGWNLCRRIPEGTDSSSG